MGQESRGSPAGALDVEQEARIRAFIARVDARLTYATRSWLLRELQADFDQFRDLIRKHGYPMTFWNQTWTYLDVDGWMYWESKSWYADGGKMLNRARLQGPAEVGL